MSATSRTTLAAALAALADSELAAICRGVTTGPELYALAGRPRVAAYYLALDFLLAAETIRRTGGGDAVERAAATLASATKDLDIMEQATVGQNLVALAAAPDETPPAAALWRALLRPIRRELDVRAAPA